MIREHIDLIENAQPDMVALARKLLVSLRASGGYQDAKAAIKINLGLEPYGADKDPPNMESLVLEWCVGALSDAYANITAKARGGFIPAWREITAGPNWHPGEWEHPGVYWSWSEKAAEAHWGSEDHEGAGSTKWMMAGQLPLERVDWETTLVQNADPSYADECEIRVHPTAQIEIINYWQVK